MAESLNRLEILAPARDLTVAQAAVDHGADAVYMGGPGFGARADAGNSMADVEAAVRYAHRFHARVYMTLNTLIFDNELEDALRVARQAYDAGVDALIVQDMGLLECDLPPIEIHASTQCDIRTPEKAAFLDRLGFAQVVLARELTLAEIAECRRAMPHARIEFFVHGALCVSYSGRCYLSCAQCSRSANRGACAQPCRLPYDVYDTFGREIVRSKHVLSLMDNDQSDNLAALIQAGVSSFKIEGRLKDADYVKNITAHYRRRLDAFLESPEGAAYQRASLGKTEFSFSPDPAKTFHRGKTDYFVNGRRPMIANLDTPKSTGEFVGTVCAIHRQGPQSIDIASRVALANGDGLVYLNEAEELEGLSVNRVETLDAKRQRIFLHEPLARHASLTVGTKLSRNKDRIFSKMLEGNTSDRRMDVDFVLTAACDKLSLTATAVESGECVTIDRAFACSPAKDAQKTQAAVNQALSQTGETIFAARGIKVVSELENAAFPFIALSVLKSLRREALAALVAKVAESHVLFGRLPCLDPDFKNETFKPAAVDFTLNCANKKAHLFYRRLGIENVPAAFELTRDTLDLSTCELMRCRHCIRHTLGLCPKTVKGSVRKKVAFKAANGGVLKPLPLVLVNSKGQKLMAKFDCRACEMTISALPKNFAFSDPSVIAH